MQIYLPIAEMSVSIALILAMGGAVGFLSGMFGIGGGFLMTPFLMFAGVPPTVAVATGSSPIIASSVSGVLTQMRRNAVDFRMGGVLVAGGIAGSATGIWLFSILREAGQVDLVISLSYVVLLTTVGALMLNESLRVLWARRMNIRRPHAKRSHHNWMQGLPFKMRFRASKLYASALPPLVLGFGVGVLAAIMGVGGGFIMIPAMVYLLRMPTAVVVGTSMFQVLCTAALSTFLHSVENQTVDLVLGVLLMVSSAIGSQFGARLGARLRGEELRALLGLLVAGVALRLLIELVLEPSELFSVTIGEAL